jgi:hypothetical protein
MRSAKTADQLKREIAYYADQLQRTRSTDRIERAHKAIRIREQQLTEALRVEAMCERSG